ncbi:MAG: hypothetical protein NT178_01425 [Proteobacteria bacterium]|nr:hypothetical protein [Pseudomonadota bacterium]
MILITHHTGEPHGILGAQTACTYMTTNLNMPSIVVGIERQFSKELLLKFLDDYYEGKEKIIGFSHLCGRKDLVELIGAVKERSFFTILGGPQAEKDYYGEIDSVNYTTRFKGLHKEIDLAIQGPVDYLKQEDFHSKTGCLSFPWGKNIALNVDWANMYTFTDALKRLEVKTAQVLNSIGCPYAKKKNTVSLPLPDTIKERSLFIDVESYGCIFCDVARDKGFHGRIDRDMVLAQIKALPEENGRKIPFEIIDEYPINSLKQIIDDAAGADIELSRIDLVCRIDDINAHKELLADILKTAKERQLTIMFSSIGFESFNDKILRFLNKGITVDDIVKCVGILRQLKDRFGDSLLYRSDEGANHGFIHPTPWDDSETISENNMNILMYRLFDDILPTHSVPLIIHHSSYLGDWIRQIESELNVAFKRDGSWIEWWSSPVSNA